MSERIPGQALVTWVAPSHSNGQLLYYLIERAEDGREEYTQLHNGSASGLLVFGDSPVEPYTNYSYRIVAVNSAGSTTGPATRILTLEAG